MEMKNKFDRLDIIKTQVHSLHVWIKQLFINLELFGTFTVINI